MINQIDLSNCDKEKINLVGAIQPHGYFFAFRISDQTVYHVSQNVADLVLLSPGDVVGKSLAQLFGESSARQIANAGKDVEPAAPQFLRIDRIQDRGGNYEVFLYALDGLIGLEIESHSSSTNVEMSDVSDSHRKSQTFVENLDAGESLGEIARLTCKAIRSMIGFERVMMYRYLPNWDGEVVGEDKSAEAHSFMGHRFPASDIPLPARTLYLKNRSRLIADSKGVAIAIEPSVHYLTRKPLDLTFSKLRAVSPIHLEYLKNMNVAASFSVAVIVRGELWGLIACHGHRATVIPHEVRLACETMASTFAILASMKERFDYQAQRLSFEQSLRAIFRKLFESSNLLSAIMKNYEMPLKAFKSAGIALVRAGKADVAGLAPPESIVLELADSIRDVMTETEKNVIALDSLRHLDEKFEILKELACGALAVRSTSGEDSLLIMFRPEVLQTIVWGGDPRKTMEKRDYQGVINPRKSFESWSQTVSGKSKPWDDYEIKGAEFFRDFIFDGLIKKEMLIEEIGQQFPRR